MRSQYEDAVNAKFIEEIGVIIAEAVEDGTDQHDYIDRLAAHYEQVIGELPVLAVDDEDDE